MPGVSNPDRTLDKPVSYSKSMMKPRFYLICECKFPEAFFLCAIAETKIWESQYKFVCVLCL